MSKTLSERVTDLERLFTKLAEEKGIEVPEFTNSNDALFRAIVEVTCAHFRIDKNLLEPKPGLKQKVSGEAANAKSLILYLMREMTTYSFPEIAEKVNYFFRMRDHTAVMYHHKVISKEAEVSKSTNQLIAHLKIKINARLNSSNINIDQEKS